MQAQIAERAKGLLGIVEPPPEFGAAGSGPGTPATGTTPEMPPTPLGEPTDPERLR